MKIYYVENISNDEDNPEQIYLIDTCGFGVFEFSSDCNYENNQCWRSIKEFKQCWKNDLFNKYAIMVKVYET